MARMPSSIIASTVAQPVGQEVRRPLDPASAPGASVHDLDARLVVLEAESALDHGVDQPPTVVERHERAPCHRPGDERDGPVVPFESRLDHEARHQALVERTEITHGVPDFDGLERLTVDALDD